MDDSSPVAFNFWPSFADMMLAIVFVLVLVLFVVTVVMTAGTTDLSRVQQSQETIIASIARAYDAEIKKDTTKTDTYSLSISGSGTPDIIIYNQPTTQRLTFSSNILFPKGIHQLNANGRSVIKTVGNVLKKELPSILRIQIEGHADIEPTTNYPSNTHLAALRAIAVFDFLQDSVAIDPVTNLMSIASFGEFKPVDRSEDDAAYDWRKLDEANSTPTLQDRNRRIELLLFYRY